MNERMAQSYDVMAQSDGSVRVRIDTLDDPEVVGRGKLVATVHVDGSMSVDEVVVESPQNVLESRCADRMSACAAHTI